MLEPVRSLNWVPGTRSTFYLLKEQSACISCSSVSTAVLAKLKFLLNWVLSSPEIVVASAECLEDCFWVNKVQGWIPWWKEHTLSLKLNKYFSFWFRWSEGLSLKKGRALKPSINKLQGLKWFEWTLIGCNSQGIAYNSVRHKFQDVKWFDPRLIDTCTIT